MKTVAVVAAVLLDTAQAAPKEAVAYTDSFEGFIAENQPKYASETEKATRAEIFAANMKFAEEVNAKQSSYTLGVTPFADLAFEEFRAHYVGGMTSVVQNVTKFEAPADFVPEDDVDWTTKGAVTPVKNQGRCGSCWTFSTTGALEGAMAVAGRTLVPLSEQELVSCDTGLIGGHGCQGGNPMQALGWVKSKGICSEEASPYHCMDQTAEECKAASCLQKSCKPVLKGAPSFFSHGDVTTVSAVGHAEKDLEAAVTNSPVSVAIEADKPAFQLYTGGVLTSDACGQTLDHAVLAVGYGVDNGVKYWKVKNSWGEKWGEKGYIRMQRGNSQATGECGIRGMASFAVVKAAEAVVV